jgi:hypothetical protein
MKLKSSTLALVAIALLTVGGLYVWQRQAPSTDTKDEALAGKPLFQFKETDITKVVIQQPTQTLSLIQGNKGWQIVAPKPGPADEGSVTFLLNLLATGTSEKTLQAEAKQLSEFGLAQKPTTIDITLKNQKRHRLVLGNQTFDQGAVYARIDPDAAANTTVPISIIPTGFLDAVNRPLSEWQAKPQPKTPAAPPSP